MAKGKPRMTAIVSGQAGIVVLNKGLKCLARRISTPEYQPCVRSDIPYLFSDATDVISMQGKSPEQAYRIMESEWEKDRCLHLLLILLDASAFLYARRLASENLDGLLHSESTQTFVHHRLYARPLPASADLTWPLELAQDNGAKLLWHLLMSLRQAQSRIKDVRERWEALDSSLFGDYSAKHLFEQTAIEEGLFFDLCRTTTRFGTELTTTWMTNPRFKEFRNSSDILSVWTQPFLQPRPEPQRAVQWSLFENERQSG